ncbi:MAG: hypothetical protein ISS70_01535 [Phycisphaerae bacterium]|nr:hypothetical protein [Phycisphaerae bacterium]
MKTKTPTPDLEYYMGKLDPEYESKGQETIGRMLDEYRIPFFYKNPILVWEDGERRIKRPDFTLPTYNNTVIEYTPVPDEAAREDSRIYKENRIAALFLKDSDLTGPDWQQKLYDKLAERYHHPQSFSIDRYQPS